MLFYVSLVQITVILVRPIYIRFSRCSCLVTFPKGLIHLLRTQDTGCRDTDRRKCTTNTITYGIYCSMKWSPVWLKKISYFWFIFLYLIVLTRKQDTKLKLYQQCWFNIHRNVLNLRYFLLEYWHPRHVTVNVNNKGLHIILNLI